MHTQLLCVDYESDFVVHMDPHCLIPCFMEDGMQLECATLQNSIAFRDGEARLASSNSKQDADVISVQGRLHRCLTVC